MKKNNNQISKLEGQSVLFLDKDKVDIRGELICGTNVQIDINVIFKGKVELGNSVVIGANTIVNNSVIKSGTKIKDYSLIKNVTIGEHCIIGPFSRLRTGTNIGDYSNIGTFVEIKNSIIGSNCKINHMAFIGDARLGDDVIIGAGSITCNHDGEKSQETIIHSGVYIGSNVNLIAPIEIGENAIIGAGSTISRYAPQNKLTLERSKEVSIDNKRKS